VVAEEHLDAAEVDTANMERAHTHQGEQRNIGQQHLALVVAESRLHGPLVPAVEAGAA
jgi:hypothetical protein